MIIKAVDIARELGISKATVSLALNNKPGVNEHTKELIFECKRRLERGVQGRQSYLANGRADIIKLITMSHSYRIVIEREIDFWTDEKAIFTRIASNWGCKLDIVYFDVDKDSSDSLVQMCNREDVLGVVIDGTELIPSDSKLLNQIHKPLVLYDVDLYNKHNSCVLMDNRGGIYDAMDALTLAGCKNIVYLAMDYDIYNFISRRQAFIRYMQEHNLDDYAQERMVRVGKSIAETYTKFDHYLDKNPLPDAFIAESYHISISALRLFRERGIKLPEDVSLAGVDELPNFLTGDYHLSTVKIPTTERAKLTMEMLKHEIEDPCELKTKLYTACSFIPGDTI
ncbi:MAG: LacI family transcriptional regulator [Treponema sp.]|nr:LacI family transcriptional regulator [Treponema sp.]